MSTLAALVPDFVAEVRTALSTEGRSDLIPQLEVGVIERCTYDPCLEAEFHTGYIYLVRPRPSWYFEKLSKPVAETISFWHLGFNVDVGHDGHLFGIELLNRADVFAKLRDANAL
jgi:hypothetical protein